jgi:glycosyltransferase involved in cell wall biosynthesis
VKILLDNVNLGSSSGPNHFGSKLMRYLEPLGIQCITDDTPSDIQLSFIETHKAKVEVPLILRMDGIYFDVDTDYIQKNKNILRTYKMADGVVFQSEYSKELIFKHFGNHSSYEIIHNGADLKQIESAPKLDSHIFGNHGDIWSCASSWYYNNNPATPRRFKRLGENIEFFLKYSKPADCFVVAGDVPPQDRLRDDRIHYIGHLERPALFSLYKASKYFVHLCSPDSCPNVIIDARAAGCKIVCSSLGGSKEIAGPDAMVVREEDWDYEPMQLNGPRRIDLTNITPNCYNTEVSMTHVAHRYEAFLRNFA